MRRDQHQARKAGDATRERILEHALPLFARYGFDGTSVRMVGEAAQCNVATLAYHFGDKQGLYDAAIRSLYEELRRLPSVPFHGGEDPLRSVVVQLWRFARDHQLQVRLLHRHVIDAGALPAMAIDHWADLLMDRVTGWLSLLRPASSPSELRFIVWTILHLIVRLLLEPEGTFGRLYASDRPRDEMAERWLVHVARQLLAAPTWEPGPATGP